MPVKKADFLAGKKYFDNPREIALKILERVNSRQDSYADILLNATLKKKNSLSEIDKAFITQMVYGILRWQGKIDFLIGQSSRIPIGKLESRVLNILRQGIYQLLFLTKVPKAAAIDETVKLAKLFFPQKTASFVNAVLRSVDRSRNQIAFPRIDDNPSLHISLVYSHPRWIVERWISRFGIDEAVKLCITNNKNPPLTVRVNTVKTERQNLMEEMRKMGLESSPTPFSPDGITIKKHYAIFRLALFRKGWFQVQDEASQLISLLLAPQPGESVLDVCAAPGGKTTHLSQLMKNQGEIYAVDGNPARLNLLKKNAQRLGITQIKTFMRDCSQPFTFPDKELFDRILIDAPCSGLGTIRRNPDSKWRKKEKDVADLQRLQLKILTRVSSLLKPDGALVFSVCTFTSEENEEVINLFLKKNPDFLQEDLSAILPSNFRTFVDSRGFFRSLPHLHQMDGFFAARIRRISG